MRDVASDLSKSISEKPVAPEPRQSDGVELTIGLVRQRSAINIGELESDMETAGKVTARDREVIRLMRKADGNGNGKLDALETISLVHEAAQSRLSFKRLRLWLSVAVVFIVILLLGNGGLIAVVMAIYKDTYVKGDTTMSDANGKVVGTRVATHDLPLLVAPVLPLEELFSVETIRVTLPGSSVAGPIENSRGEPNNEVGSGEANNEVGPGVVNSFRISRVEKVNSTAVVFHVVGGQQIRVWNGVTTVWNGISAEIPVCSANVTCAAFQVEGAELAEKYLVEAEALLVPFEEGRRRLAEACRDPF